MPAPLVGLAVGAAARAVAKKVAGDAAKKVAKKAATKASARALKAAQGKSLAKGTRKLDASSGSVERRIVRGQAETNMILGSSRKQAFSKAAEKSDKERIKDIAEAKKILARAKAEKNAKTISKALKKK